MSDVPTIDDLLEDHQAGRELIEAVSSAQSRNIQCTVTDSQGREYRVHLRKRWPILRARG